MKKYFKQYLESTLLDGNDVYDCGKAMIQAEEVFEVLLPFISGIISKIKNDLLAIADEGEYEDLRREVTNYFNKLN